MRLGYEKKRWQKTLNSLLSSMVCCCMSRVYTLPTMITSLCHNMCMKYQGLHKLQHTYDACIFIHTVWKSRWWFHYQVPKTKSQKTVTNESQSFFFWVYCVFCEGFPFNTSFCQQHFCLVHRLCINTSWSSTWKVLCRHDGWHGSGTLTYPITQ